MYSTDAGHTFGHKFISAETSDIGPSLAVIGNLLFIAWKGSGNDNLNVARVQTIVNQGVVVVGPFLNKITLTDTSSASPALAGHNNFLFLAWKGSGNDNLSVSLADGTHKFIAPQTSDAAPSLVSHNGGLFIAWKGSGNPQLYIAEVALQWDPAGGPPTIGPLINLHIFPGTSDAGPTLASNGGLLYYIWRARALRT